MGENNSRLREMNAWYLTALVEEERFKQKMPPFEKGMDELIIREIMKLDPEMNKGVEVDTLVRTLIEKLKFSELKEELRQNKSAARQSD